MKRYIVGAALTALIATAFAQQSGHSAGGPQHQQLAQAAGGTADQSLPSGFEAKPLIKSSETRDKQPIVYPKTDKPEIISVIGTIAAGGRTPLHEHPVPTYVYVLEGEVELQSEGGQPQVYKTGEAYIEALNQKHQLFNKSNAPAKVLVVFVGEVGKPTTIAAK
ncbi:MAG TPA: cupin domain-containing protein [Xanthobacteraceae bacterium]|nr:cupin domain-containing protein [Xanthobacteraceae bacterium]